ncbi:hypothetical protein [Saccharothrix sp. Mg75]|uniref:hypothetical protein n=1 Tax=Saccharothrix sp. Mg75 TaxID=3445357 RepID=UPI003EEA519A
MLDELRSLSDAGDTHARRQLYHQLAKHDTIDELRARGDAGDTDAVIELARHLATRGRLSVAVTLLRSRAETDSTCAWALADLIAKHGEHELLWDEVHAGNKHASRGLINSLQATGQQEHAERLRMWGLTSDGVPSLPW